MSLSSLQLSVASQRLLRSLSQYTVIWLVSIIGFSTVFLALYSVVLTDNTPDYSLQGMLQRTAIRPYVYRLIVPELTRQLSQWLALPWQFVAVSIIVSCWIGFLVALYALSRCFYTELQSRLVLLLTPILLMPLGRNFGHSYDIPVLFFVTLTMLYMYQQRWSMMLLLFAVATLNKETSILLIGVFIVNFYHQRHQMAFYQLVFVLCGVYGIIRVIQLWLFADVPGALIYFNLWIHLELSPQRPLLLGFHVIYGFLAVFLSILDWQRKPQFLIGTTLFLFPLLLLFYLFSGFPFEIRIFYEVFPSMVLLVVPSLINRVGRLWQTL